VRFWGSFTKINVGQDQRRICILVVPASIAPAPVSRSFPWPSHLLSLWVKRRRWPQLVGPLAHSFCPWSYKHTSVCVSLWGRNHFEINFPCEIYVYVIVSTAPLTPYIKHRGNTASDPNLMQIAPKLLPVHMKLTIPLGFIALKPQIVWFN